MAAKTTKLARILAARLATTSRRAGSAVASNARSTWDRSAAVLAKLADSAAPRERLADVRSRARAVAVTYERDDREALALLVLPFLIVATAIVMHHSARSLNAYLTLAGIAEPDQQVAPLRPTVSARSTYETLPASAARPAIGQTTALAPASATLNSARAAGGGSALPLARVDRSAVAVPAGKPLPANMTETEIATVGPPERVETPRAAALALLAPSDRAGQDMAPVPPGSIAALDTDENGLPIRPGICSREDAERSIAMASLAPAPPPASMTDDAFGLTLAKAAESQVGQFVIYNDAYRSMSYPRGDVNGLFGVCTDVIVRAYRALEIDLQTLVHRARAGSGDTNIDHRRTEVLRRFFAAQGESLPVSSFAEDYRPGDIVTYHRPQNQRSRSHIAMVSAVIAPSGRPMIIHNRGWGPQLEDGLFVDQITGHYRYRPSAAVRNASQAPAPAGKAATGKKAGPSATVTISFPAN
jgi:uncharacterized protein YijF (DUF1287 family)